MVTVTTNIEEPNLEACAEMDEPYDKTGVRLLRAQDADSDEALAALAYRGDEDAFEELFNRHHRRVARIAGKFFNRRERIEEIVQEVFAKMYFALGDYSSDHGAAFGAWLSRIAVNHCYDQLRRAGRRPEKTSETLNENEARAHLRSHLSSSVRNAESATISRDLANKLLARLSADDRLVLTMLDAEEMAVADIAVLLGWSISKVKVRAHRARASLRRIVGEFL